MSRLVRLLISTVVAALLLNTFTAMGQKVKVPDRTVAITFDDLPVVSTRGDLATRQEITRKLLAHIKQHHIPAIGFVNEGQVVSADGKRREEQIDLLRAWTAAGLELGNHSFSHRSLNATPLADYEADLLKGEPITRELLAQRGLKLRFFRHPYLHTGRTLEIRSAFLKFLTEHGYQVAPVTFDNGDWIFARAYDNAITSQDEKLRLRIAEAYVPYMSRKVDYWERQSVAVVGYEVKQIFLLHANAINADLFGDLATMLEQRHYRFITLEEAVNEPAYKTQRDEFTGGSGISWIHRWALTKGKQFILTNEPTVPEFVLKAAGVESE